jgi:hypothetical protein
VIGVDGRTVMKRSVVERNGRTRLVKALDGIIGTRIMVGRGYVIKAAYHHYGSLGGHLVSAGLVDVRSLLGFRIVVWLWPLKGLSNPECSGVDNVRSQVGL